MSISTQALTLRGHTWGEAKAINEVAGDIPDLPAAVGGVDVAEHHPQASGMFDRARTSNDLEHLLVPGVTAVGPHAHRARLALRRRCPGSSKKTAQERRRGGDATRSAPDVGLLFTNFHGLGGGERSVRWGAQSACRRVRPTKRRFERKGLPERRRVLGDWRIGKGERIPGGE